MFLIVAISFVGQLRSSMQLHLGCNLLGHERRSSCANFGGKQSCGGQRARVV